jgi:hypothetical protein
MKSPEKTMKLPQDGSNGADDQGADEKLKNCGV